MSGTVTYDYFFPEVIPFVRDVPEFVALNAIRNACIEFCEKSTYWRQIVDPITIVAEQAEYDLDIEAGTGVSQILSAYMGSRELAIMAPEGIKELIGPDWRDQTGMPMYVTSEEYNIIRVVMIPETTSDDDLSLTVALRPLRSSTKVSKDVYERYSEIIGFGARARLHDTPQQPYSDEESAMKFRKWFESGIGEAKIAANRARSRTVLYVRPPRV